MDRADLTMKLSEANGAVYDECLRATEKYGALHGPHEGYAVILEEVDELWDEIKAWKQGGSVRKMREEALQVAAMAMRFLVDIESSESAHFDGETEL